MVQGYGENPHDTLSNCDLTNINMCNTAPLRCSESLQIYFVIEHWINLFTRATIWYFANIKLNTEWYSFAVISV